MKTTEGISAKLIAAAPDLLEALKIANKIIRQNEMSKNKDYLFNPSLLDERIEEGSDLDIIRKAIDKAEN